MRRHERGLLLASSIVALVVAASLTMLNSTAAGQGAFAESGAEGEGTGEGEVLTVHGAWSIRVLDQHGELDQQIDFSNDLTPAGARTLTALLTGAARADDWAIRLSGSPTELCGSPPTSCRLAEPRGDALEFSGDALEFSGDALEFDGDLSVAPTDDGSGFALSGEVEVARGGSIDFVETHLARCDVSTEECTVDAATTLFTATGLEPIEVDAGQVVDVVVVISFD